MRRNPLDPETLAAMQDYREAVRVYGFRDVTQKAREGKRTTDARYNYETAVADGIIGKEGSNYD